ncbi:MAG: outer membrane lipoprotein-sorting protein [Polyangiales bacterium]
MILTDGQGKTHEHALDVTGRKKDGRYQGLVRFSAPTQVAGTAFLMLERGEQEFEQYIFLPSIRRTRRIAGRERDASFMGSDFTYADMQGVDPKHAKHTRLADEKVGNELCYVLESTVADSAHVSYGKVLTWVRQSDMVALRTRFYDRAGKPAKTLYSRRVKAIDGKPIVVDARMHNEQASHSTEIIIDSVERKDDLSDSQFTPAELEHQ